MPHTLWYTLHRLPDLSLGAYSALPNSQHEALLAQFTPSLRMLHRLALSYSLELRWWAHFDPNRPSGERLQLALGFAGQPADLEQAPIDAMLRATPIAPYFVDATSGLQRGNILAQATPSTAPRLLGCQVARLERYWALTELGDEAFQRQSELPVFLHAVYPWEANEGCRLVSALQLMQQLGEASVITMALHPSEGEQEYDRLQPFYASALAKLAGGSYKDALGRTEFIKAGPVAEQLRSLRQDLLDKIRCEPCFTMQLRCYASTRDKARMLTDTVLAEALTKGPHATWPLPIDVDYFAPAPADLLCLPPPAGVGLPEDLQRLSGLFTLSEVGSLFRLPVLYEGEALDLRKETYPQIDAPLGRSLHLGLLDESGKLTNSVDIPLDAMVKHTLVVGVPGSGKTNTLLGLANQVWGQFGVPFLALEPAKREYRGLLNLPACSGQVMLFAPGRAAPHEWLMLGEYNPLALQINPFEFPVGYSLAEHNTNLLEIFKGAFGLWQPLPSMVEAALTTAYAELGWDTADLASSEKVAAYGFPSMPRFVELLRAQAESTDYIGDNAANVKAGLELRFGRLVDGPLASVFSAQSSSLRPEDWLRTPAVVELESLGESNANFLTLLLLTYLRETLTVQKEEDRENGTAPAAGFKLKHLLFLEEAHNLIGPSAERPAEDAADPKAAATAYIVKMLAEVRALGQGIVIGDQLPSNLAPEVLKNTSVRICHRLTAPDDRKHMQQSMNASELQFELMAIQTSGRALISLEGVRKPFSVMIAAADRESARHDQAISDQAFLAAVCRAHREPDARFARNALRMYMQALDEQQAPPLNGLSTAALLTKLQESIADLRDVAPEATAPVLLNKLRDLQRISRVAEVYLERSVRLLAQQAPWLALKNQEDAQTAVQHSGVLRVRLNSLRDARLALSDRVEKAQPNYREDHPAWFALSIAIHCQDGNHEYIPKSAVAARQWLSNALTIAQGVVDTEGNAGKYYFEMMYALQQIHYRLWLIRTQDYGSVAVKRTKRQLAMPHLRRAAELGSMFAQFELSQDPNCLDARSWLKEAAAQNHPKALALLKQDHSDPELSNETN